MYGFADKNPNIYLYFLNIVEHRLHVWWPLLHHNQINGTWQCFHPRVQCGHSVIITCTAVSRFAKKRQKIEERYIAHEKSFDHENALRMGGGKLDFALLRCPIDWWVFPLSLLNAPYLYNHQPPLLSKSPPYLTQYCWLLTLKNGWHTVTYLSTAIASVR